MPDFIRRVVPGLIGLVLAVGVALELQGLVGMETLLRWTAVSVALYGAWWALA